jgi:hypothetical protein
MIIIARNALTAPPTPGLAALTPGIEGEARGKIGSALTKYRERLPMRSIRTGSILFEIHFGFLFAVLLRTGTQSLLQERKS